MPAQMGSLKLTSSAKGVGQTDPVKAELQRLDSALRNHTHSLNIGVTALSAIPGMQDLANKAGYQLRRPAVADYEDALDTGWWPWPNGHSDHSLSTDLRDHPWPLMLAIGVCCARFSAVNGHRNCCILSVLSIKEMFESFGGQQLKFSCSSLASLNAGLYYIFFLQSQDYKAEGS